MGSVVVLNGSAQYWGERSLKDVIKLHAKQKISIVVGDEDQPIRAGMARVGVNFTMEMPLVVMLKTFFGCTVPGGPVGYSDEAVYRRDNNVCQYWHYDEFLKPYKHKCTREDRTIDHIVPRCRGGEYSFENCVCACKVCNNRRKGARSVKQARLKLIRIPVALPPREESWVVMDFNFNPDVAAHRAYKEHLDSLVAA